MNEFKKWTDHMQSVISSMSSLFSQDLKTLIRQEWPEAVPPNMICDHSCKTDKMERSRGIIESIINESIENRKFLDFGCGDGWCVNISTEYGARLSVGYDLKQHQEWTNHKGVLLSDNLEQIKSMGPYDVILLYDVIDHADDIDNILPTASSLLAADGAIYTRFHPFTSRHGTHLWNQINKAYIHLVFNDNQLKEIYPEISITKTNKITTPIKNYSELIKKSGLKVKNRYEINNPVETFFKNELIQNAIKNNLKIDFFPEKQMSIQFVDYCLSK